MERALERAVRQRAGEICEYCRLPQRLSRVRFQIDHIIARQHGGKSVLDNLALACLRCNVHKGPNLAGIDPGTGERTMLFNPRQDDWNEHFAWDGPRLLGKTPVGQSTIEVLAINHPIRVSIRAGLIASGRWDSTH